MVSDAGTFVCCIFVVRLDWMVVAFITCREPTFAGNEFSICVSDVFERRGFVIHVPFPWDNDKFTAAW